MKEKKKVLAVYGIIILFTLAILAVYVKNLHKIDNVDPVVEVDTEKETIVLDDTTEVPLVTPTVSTEEITVSTIPSTTDFPEANDAKYISVRDEFLSNLNNPLLYCLTWSFKDAIVTDESTVVIYSNDKSDTLCSVVEDASGIYAGDISNAYGSDYINVIFNNGVPTNAEDIYKAASKVPELGDMFYNTEYTEGPTVELKSASGEVFTLTLN